MIVFHLALKSIKSLTLPLLDNSWVGKTTELSEKISILEKTTRRLVNNVSALSKRVSAMEAN